jgi:putative membrane protein
MMPAHPGVHADDDAANALTAPTVLSLTTLLVVTVGYLILASRRRREPRGWSGLRTVGLLAGSTLLAVALAPGTLPWPHGDFRGHMLQHLIIGMVAPLLLVLGAPMTLLLRSVPSRFGRVVGRCLRSRPLHLVANPVTALVLSVGGLAALYFTPLYALTTDHEVLHGLVHLHFLVAGYLFAWVIAGPDPAPRRPSVPVRLVVLGVAVGLHATASQMLYAGILVQVPVSVAERQGAGELIYYGGDIAELLVAVALVVTWRPRRPEPDPSIRRLPARAHGTAPG